MKSLVTALCGISLLFLVNGCKKKGVDDSNNVNQGKIVQSQFEGTSSDGNITNDIEGVLEINEDHQFTLNAMTGALKGTAVKNNNKYTITINDYEGSFESISSLSGEYSEEDQELVLDGIDVEEKNISIKAKVWTNEGYNKEWRDNRSKSSVYFTHNETCGAIITIADETLDTLFQHWHPGGYCDSYYDLFISIPQDVDNNVSQTFCNTFKLKKEDGSYANVKSCPSAVFVLNKNTTYNYSVLWANGETSSGSFTMPDGGERIAECIENSGPECYDDGSGDDGSGEWQIISNTITVNGSSVSFDEDSVYITGNAFILNNKSDDVAIHVKSGYNYFSEGLTITEFSTWTAWDVYYDKNDTKYDVEYYYGGDQGSITVSEFSTDATTNDVKKITLEFNSIKCSSDGLDEITINGTISLSR